MRTVQRVGAALRRPDLVALDVDDPTSGRWASTGTGAVVPAEESSEGNDRKQLFGDDKQVERLHREIQWRRRSRTVETHMKRMVLHTHVFDHLLRTLRLARPLDEKQGRFGLKRSM